MLPELVALAKVILIDISLSGDNAIVIGMAAAGLPDQQRKKAIVIGILCAVGLRIAFSIATVHLLAFPALAFFGGLMLLYVCWKMLKDILDEDAEDKEAKHTPKSLWHSVWLIIIADVSMSLDNVLAVASASQEHIWVMAFGLVLSIALMAFAANLVVGLLKRWKWLNWVGLAIIAYVAVDMMWKSYPHLISMLSRVCYVET